MLIDQIKQQAKEIFPLVTANRRYLHANPELSFLEYGTAHFVKKKLDELSIPWQAMANTGIVALIKGDISSDRVLALRADMDALPITENNSHDFVSTNPGVMHACGHDAHTSSLLGTAQILKSLTGKFGGTIKLIFQPGEEVLPGGASIMIKEGVLDNPRPMTILGQHVMPSLECGMVAVRKGKHMASMDAVYFTVIGKGGHAAQPHQNIDPVLITAHIIVALQQVVSRMANPALPTVLSFGKVIASGAVNVIPDKVKVEGTFRTMDESWRSDAHQKMIKMAESIAESMGAACEMNIVRGYPFLINEEKLTTRFKSYAEEYLGKEKVVEADIWMAAEDFSYYSQVTDACFYLLGTGNKKRGITSALHTPTFDIDENALAVSTGLMAYAALRQLEVSWE